MDGVPLTFLRACYHAFLQRRLERGGLSVRTRSGYERLRSKYQARVRLLQDGLPTSQRTTDLENGSEHEDSDGEPQGDVSDWDPIERLVDAEEAARVEFAADIEETEEQSLMNMIGVFFDARVKRFISDVCWPLAHYGGEGNRDHAHPRRVSEWRELEQDKYFAVMLKVMVWLFPGLPAFKAQEQAERDWQKDCEFDSYGAHGLSFEGFTTSLLDLATACTDGTVDKCLEFLRQMAKRLQTTLPVFRIPTNHAPMEDGDEGDENDNRNPLLGQLNQEIVWLTIPLEKLSPHMLQTQVQFFEIKAKLSASPLVLMFLVGEERPVELQLSTSAKLLVRERDHRTSVRRQTLGLKSHYIEVDQHYLWTLRDFSAVPSVFVLPNELISRRTLSIYACLRLMEQHEHETHVANARDAEATTTTTATDPSTKTPAAVRQDNDASVVPSPAAAGEPPIFTFFTSVQTPFRLMYGHERSLCGRVERHTSRLFTIDHRDRHGPFAITLRSSLVQNLMAGGGAGAAMPITSRDPSASNVHTFVFIIKVDAKMAPDSQDDQETGHQAVRVESSLPLQWVTMLSGANETRTIVVDHSTVSPCCSQHSNHESHDTSMAGLYYMFVVALHGFYFEATYEETTARQQPGTLGSFLEWQSSRALRQAQGSKGTARSLSSSKDDTDGDTGNRGHSRHHRDLENIEDEDDALVKEERETLGKLNGITSSAMLLQKLLQLRKRRQTAVMAQPPTDFLPGSKFRSIRAVTTAATLRSKFLNARATERRARQLEGERAFRAKVLAQLLRSQSKRMHGRQARLQGDAANGDNSAGDLTAAQSTQTLEMQVNVLASFFKEMALYQPKQEEIDREASDQEAHIQQQEQLLEHFADLFEDDTALQNILDIEEWMSPEEKNAKRREFILEMFKKRVDEAQAQHNKVLNATASGDKQQHSSEDYDSTAKFIERLMREVAEDERATAAPSVAQVRRDQQRDATEQLAASWAYAQHLSLKKSPMRAASASASALSREANAALAQLEARRRADWMKSRHVTKLALHEKASHAPPSALRSPLIPTMQHFHEQEQQLPWQPVWEVPVELELNLAVSDTSSTQPPQATPHPRSTATPRRPPSRPHTAAPATPRPVDTQHVSQSASLNYKRVRRIRSANAASTRSPRERPPVTEPPNPTVLIVPQAFMHSYSEVAEPIETVVEKDFEADSTDPPTLQPVELMASNSPQQQQKAESAAVHSCIEIELPTETPTAPLASAFPPAGRSASTSTSSRSRRGSKVYRERTAVPRMPWSRLHAKSAAATPPQRAECAYDSPELIVDPVLGIVVQCPEDVLSSPPSLPRQPTTTNRAQSKKKTKKTKTKATDTAVRLSQQRFNHHVDELVHLVPR